MRYAFNDTHSYNVLYTLYLKPLRYSLDETGVTGDRQPSAAAAGGWSLVRRGGGSALAVRRGSGFRGRGTTRYTIRYATDNDQRVQRPKPKKRRAPGGRQSLGGCPAEASLAELASRFCFLHQWWPRIYRRGCGCYSWCTGRGRSSSRSPCAGSDGSSSRQIWSSADRLFVIKKRGGQNDQALRVKNE